MSNEETVKQSEKSKLPSSPMRIPDQEHGNLTTADVEKKLEE